VIAGKRFSFANYEPALKNWTHPARRQKGTKLAQGDVVTSLLGGDHERQEGTSNNDVFFVGLIAGAARR
jgi:hypothetical protein